MSDKINSLNSSVQVTAASGYVVNKTSLFKTGKQVSGSVEIINRTGNAIPANTWTTLATVSVLPKSDDTSPAVPCVNSGVGAFAGMMVILSTGNLRIYTPNAVQNNHGVCANFSYETV